MLRQYPAALLFVLVAGCGGGGANNPGFEYPNNPVNVTLAPESTGDGWQTSTPAAEGMNTQQLSSVFDSIRNGTFPGVDSMVVVRHQRLIAEGYFNGFDRETAHELRSSGKSFISTIAGIAMNQGLMGLDDPLSQHIPDFESYRNMDAAKRAITLRNLLHMSSNLDCDDWDTHSPGNEEKMYDSRDWIKFMLDLPMIGQPGTTPHYCTGGVVLLAQAVAQRSGMALDTYAQQWLLAPLNIQKSVWRHSPDGKATGATGFGLRPRDAAKLGALFVNEGVWNGTRVLPESWVMATRERVVSLGNQGYGFLWWKRTFQHNGVELESIYAAGNGGNFIYYIPSHELVVAFTGSNYNTVRSDSPHQIMPLVVSALP